MTKAYLGLFTGVMAASVLAGCDASDVERLEGVGIVAATSGATSSLAFASYRRVEPRRARCPGQYEFGYCSFYDCYLSFDDSIDLAAPGTVSILGGSRDIELTLDGDYREEVADMPLFAGGEPLTFRVEGGDGIAAHEAELAAPLPITITEPDLAAPIEIDRLADFPVTWTDGNGLYAQVSLEIEQRNDADRETRYIGLACQYDPLAARVVLPKLLLTSLPPVTDAAEATLAIGVWTSLDGDVPGWGYAFRAMAGESVAVTIK